MIAQVSGGGPENMAQVVQYTYTHYQIPVTPPATGGVDSYALTGVNYGVGERPATYKYVNMTTDLIGMVLEEADDPRFMGPMKRIRYSYRGASCGTGPQVDFYKAPATAITKEMNEDGIMVSSLFIDCPSGKRTETNGLAASRMFYYGRSSPVEPGGHFEGNVQTGHWIPPEAGEFNHLSHHLVKITDFNPGQAWESVPFHYQHYKLAYPWRLFDPNGNITQVTTAQDGSGRTTEIWRRADNSKHKYNWSNPGASAARDAIHIPNTLNHWLFSETDERNLTTTYTRDALRRVTEITYPDNSREQFTYNGFNQVTAQTLANGTVLHHEYDSRGLLQQEWNSADGEAEVTNYYYDSLDRVWMVQNALARPRGFSYSAKMEYNNRHQVTKVHYPPTGGNSDPTVAYEYSPDGDCIAITNELGHRSTYKYDNYRRVVKYTEPLNAAGYDGNGIVATREWKWYYGRTTTTNVAVSPYAHTSKQWSHQYEPAYNAAGDSRVTVREYDVNDRMTAEQTGWIQPAQGSLYCSPADGETHRFTYDANGNKSSYTDPRDRLTTYQYDTLDRLITTTETANTPPRITRIEYDIAGNKTKVTFPDLETQQWPASGYDAFGQPHIFIDERNNTTNMDYWPWGPMKKLAVVTTHRSKDGGGTEDQPTRFYYDGIGRPQSTYFPDNSHEYTGYQFGQPITWETRKGQVKHIHYDARGREDYHFWENGAAPRIDRVWDDAHRLTSTANAFSTIEYGYDNAGQAKWEKTTVAGSSGPGQLVYYRYPSGEVSRQVYPNGSATVQREYTARGQLRSVSWAGGNASYTYLADGQVDQQDYGNGLQTKYEYDVRGMIYSVRHRNPGANHDLAYRQYWRDERDRITAWKRGNDRTYNQMENGRGDRYGYDEEGQLTAASYRAEHPEDTATTPYRIETFAYDELGTRKEWNDVASRGEMWMARKNNGLNQYSNWQNNHPSPNPLHWGGATNYDDDVGGTWGSPGHANGVLMQDGYVTAGFNALNQPMAIWAPVYGWGTSAQWMWFGFDPLGRCVKRWMGPATGGAVGSNPATYFYYDGWNLIQEGNGTANVARVYVHGGRIDEIVASQGGGQWRYHHYDARGHCLLLTSPGGVLLEQYDYDAFGFPYFHKADGSKQGPAAYGNRFLFTGREWLGELRLYDFRNRMYQPELGRFLQPDPKQFAAGDYNLYRYCHNDPVNYTDPDGTYAQGKGWTDENWKKFNQAQLVMAGKLDRASRVIDPEKFEKIFGAGTAMPENMNKVSLTMQKMAAALRDTKKYVADAYSEKSRVGGYGDTPGRKISINVAHSYLFGNEAALTWTAGHESGHNLGLVHDRENPAQKYPNGVQTSTYGNLPPAQRLLNPDHYVDFAW